MRKVFGERIGNPVKRFSDITQRNDRSGTHAPLQVVCQRVAERNLIAPKQRLQRIAESRSRMGRNQVKAGSEWFNVSFAVTAQDPKSTSFDIDSCGCAISDHNMGCIIPSNFTVAYLSDPTKSCKFSRVKINPKEGSYRKNMPAFSTLLKIDWFMTMELFFP